MAGKDVGLPFLSSGEGEGRGSAGRDLPEGGNLLKFILFFFTVKIPDTEARRSVAGYFSLLLGGCPPDFQAVGGPDRPLCCRAYLLSCKMLKISVLQNACLEHNTTLPFHIYSFALASIFLCGRTYLPILPHLICRLNGASERLAERPFEMRKRSETHTNFLYALSCVRSRVLHSMSVGDR